MATKKVLYVITKGNQGGAQRYVYDLVRSLPRDRFESIIAIGGHAGSWLQNACTSAGIRTVTLDSVGRDVSVAKDTASLAALIALFKKEQPDIVHLNSSKMGAVGALAARIVGVKRVIFTAHGWAFNEKRPILTRAIFWLAHAATMLLVDQTVANSAATARAAPIGWQLSTIPLGIGDQKSLSREEARTALDLDMNTIIYGCIAELHKNKGLDILVDALAMVPNGHVAIIGGGEKRAALIAKITAKKLKDRVTLVGHMENAAQYLPAFDIFVLPSRTESAGYVLLEAGLAGLPVVASAVGGIPEIIEDGVTGLLVPPENPKALAEAIQKLIADPTLREKLASALNSKILRDFSLEKMVSETLKTYVQ
jgi:glycosyltransferase involved in cell wall biosynthesis